jgi:hypothetical protein
MFIIQTIADTYGRCVRKPVLPANIFFNEKHCLIQRLKIGALLAGECCASHRFGQATTCPIFGTWGLRRKAHNSGQKRNVQHPHRGFDAAVGAQSMPHLRSFLLESPLQAARLLALRHETDVITFLKRGQARPSECDASRLSWRKPRK